MRKACFAALAVAFAVGILAHDVQARPGGRPRGARPGNAGQGPVGQNNLGNRSLGQQGPIGQGQFGQNAIGQGQLGQHKDNPTQTGQGQFGPQQIEQLHKSAQQLQQNATQQTQRQLNKANAQLRNLSRQFKSPTAADARGTAQATVQGRTSQLQTNFKSGAEPFTASWYAGHPQAWRYTHPHADAWAVATLGGLGAWLGIAALEDEPYNVYTSETTDEEAADVADQTDEGSNESAEDVGDFLPLGVFALAPAGAADASGLVQLAVNKQGELRGNYYDVLSGEDAAITGTIDKQKQLAAFQIGTSGNEQLEAPLASLTQPQANVTVRFADGETRDWTLARFDEAATGQQPTQQQQ